MLKLSSWVTVVGLIEYAGVLKQRAFIEIIFICRPLLVQLTHLLVLSFRFQARAEGFYLVMPPWRWKCESSLEEKFPYTLMVLKVALVSLFSCSPLTHAHTSWHSWLVFLLCRLLHKAGRAGCCHADMRSWLCLSCKQGRQDFDLIWCCLCLYSQTQLQQTGGGFVSGELCVWGFFWFFLIN